MACNSSRPIRPRTDRPLTVVQLLPALDGGGVESCTLEISAALVEQGHRSIVVSAGGRLVDAIEEAGGEFIQLDIGRKSPMALLKAFKLRQILVRKSVDIVHARSRMPAWIGLLALKMIPRRPRFVTTVHGLNSVNHYSKVMTYGDRVVAVSQCCRDYILKNFSDTDASKLVVIPHGIDPQRFAFGFQSPEEWLQGWTQQYPSLAGRFVVLLPGRLTQLKGHIDFLTVIALLKKRGIPVAGLLVGSEHPHRRKYASLLREEVERKGLQEEVFFTGHRDDLREIMSVSSAVVSMSTKPESFGRTVLESLSLGRPTFGYDYGGVGEILARLYPEGQVIVGDVAAMAEKLMQVYRNELQHPRPMSGYNLQEALGQEIELYESLARAN